MRELTIHLGQRLLLAILLLPFTAQDAQAFGSRNPEPKNKATQAHPFRHAELAHVTVPTFHLPNGNRVDMNTDLFAIVDTEINRSRFIRTVDMSAPNKRLVITGGITSLELDVLQLNLRIGWTPGGAIPVIGDPTVSGEVDLRLSTLSMDFKIYDRVTGETFVAAYTDETLSNLRFQVKVEIAEIGSAVELLTKTKLAEAIRDATGDIMRKLENSPSFVYVPWEARVLGADESRSQVEISAGARAGVKPNYVFSIYSTCENSQDPYCYERFLSDVKVVSAGIQSATAEPYSAADSLQGIFPNDKVYIKPMNNNRLASRP